MITPRDFAKQTGHSYNQVRKMALDGEIRCTISEGGYISIYDSEVDRILNPEKYVLRSEYEELSKNYEKLKSKLETIQMLTTNL